MSFLNPVNEPVTRFSSTDADAPQINYAARTAGDVKAVLKACLVTGYGDKASAGWSVVNEVDHVCEFVSPSAAMSDYRLGIDDTSASSTTWYYQYQNIQQTLNYSSPTKSFRFAELTSAMNGWQLLVTSQGVLFIETVQHSTINKPSSRITYFGSVKSALADTVGQNLCFFNIGHNGAIGNLYRFFDTGSASYYYNIFVGSYGEGRYVSATNYALSVSRYSQDESVIDLVSPIYLSSNESSRVLLGQLPPLLSKIVSKAEDMYDIKELSLDGRSVLSVTAGYTYDDVQLGRTFLIPLDYWEY